MALSWSLLSCEMRLSRINLFELKCRQSRTRESWVRFLGKKINKCFKKLENWKLRKFCTTVFQSDAIFVKQVKYRVIFIEFHHVAVPPCRVKRPIKVCIPCIRLLQGISMQLISQNLKWYSMKISLHSTSDRKLELCLGLWSKTNLPFEWDSVSLGVKPPPSQMRHLKNWHFCVKSFSMWKMNQNQGSFWRKNYKKFLLSQ